MGRWGRLEKWLIFIVYVAVIPAIVVALSLPLYQQELTFAAVFGKGELLISALAIAADGAGEMIGVKLSGYKLTICRICIAMVVLIAIIYGIVSTASKPPDMNILASYSLVLLLLAIAVSAPSKLWKV